MLLPITWLCGISWSEVLVFYLQVSTQLSSKIFYICVTQRPTLEIFPKQRKLLQKWSLNNWQPLSNGTSLASKKFKYLGTGYLDKPKLYIFWHECQIQEDHGASMSTHKLPWCDLLQERGSHFHHLRTEKPREADLLASGQQVEGL